MGSVSYEIAEVAARGGTIGFARCPGPASRALAADLEAVRRWGAKAVVTALHADETAAARLTALADGVEALGADWYHVPVRDFGVPDPASEARWHHAGLCLRRLLGRGGKVLLHCLGGRGRSGMLAARLLAELGERPDEAIAAVRRARPGAVENEAQADWVRAARPAAPLGRTPSLDERVLGCLLGGAVGDGFGYAVEFVKLAEIRARHGGGGLREPVHERGVLAVSDDTQMTMFTAEGLLRARARFADRGISSPAAVVWFAYRRWLATQQPAGRPEKSPSELGWLAAVPAMRARRAPGNTCLSALRRPSTPPAGPAENDSKGCGGVMRVAPAGLLPADFDVPGAYALGCELAGLTHGHPTGRIASGALAAIVRALVDGDSLEEASGAVLARLLDEASAGETSAALSEALGRASDPAADPAEDVAALGEGWIAEEALAVGLYAALRGDDFAEAVRIATNHDGDSDSTASIAGQILGARDGVEAVTQRWVRRLDVLEPLLLLAHDLAAATAGRPALASYPPN